MPTRRHWPKDARKVASCVNTSKPSSRPSPRRGRKRTPDSIRRRLGTIDAALPGSDPLARLHLVEEKQRLEAELAHSGDTVDIAALEKAFIKVARIYGDRKGISYSAWRTVGVSAPVLHQAKIPRTRG